VIVFRFSNGYKVEMENVFTRMRTILGDTGADSVYRSFFGHVIPPSGNVYGTSVGITYYKDESMDAEIVVNGVPCVSEPVRSSLYYQSAH